MSLVNICKHLLARQDLLSDDYYRKQIEEAICVEEEQTRLVLKYAFKQAEKGEPLPEWVFYHHGKYGKTVSGWVYIENLSEQQQSVLLVLFSLANNCPVSEMTLEQKFKGVL